MAKIIYNAGIWLYGVAIWLAAPFHHKAKKIAAGQKTIFDSLGASFANNTRPVYWFHCASLGEFEQGRPIMEAWKASYPQARILLTFFSPSGYEVRKNYAHADDVCYLPLDTERNAKKFLALTKPKAVFFIKYEFWYHFSTQMRLQGIPIFSVSSIFRGNQLFFKNHGEFYRSILHNFTHFFVQDDVSETLLKGIGISDVTVTGDTRFDRVFAVYNNKKSIPIVERFKSGHTILVAGSTWQPDIALLAEATEPFKNQLRIIIAPHHIHSHQLKFIHEKFAGRQILHYSEALRQPEKTDNAQILLIDNVGMLYELYQYAEIAWVGGAFGKGLHNILEAAVNGIPVFFGTKYQKFREAVQLVKLGGAFSLSSPDELKKHLKKLTEDEFFRKSTGNICREYVEKNKGATQLILKYYNDQKAISRWV